MSSIIHMPHDKLFKLSMAEIAVATEFFNAHLPATLLEKLDLSSLKLEKESFVDESYKTTEADVVYSAKIGSVTSYLYLLCEQQTKVDPNLAFRLLVYSVRIMERHRKQHPTAPLPLVYPIVVYTGEESWNAALDIFPLFAEAEALARDIFCKPYQLLDVNRMSDDDLRQHTLSGLVAFALKYRKAANFELFLKKSMAWIHQIEIQDEQGAALCRIVLKYIVDSSTASDKEVLLQESNYLSPKLQGEMMKLTEWWEENGRQQGEAAIITRQMQRRFGEDIPSKYKQRIMQADTQTLLLLSDKILDAKTVDDIFI